MWITLLLMAVAVSLEPFRIAMTVVMINRPRPLLQLLAFLAGGFAMGIAVGVVVLFLLRPAMGSAHFTLPRVQIVVGAVLIGYAAVLAASALWGRRDDESAGQAERRSGPLAMRTRRLLNHGSPWTAGVAGLGIALPSVDYLAVLALIVASGAAATTQFAALMLFNVVAFGFVETPAAGLPDRPGPHPRNDGGTAGLGEEATPPRRRRPAGRGRLRAARSGVGRALASGPAQASSRVNWSWRYCSTQAARRIFPLVVVGIDPGGTRTRSPTFKPCALDIAEVTSLLTLAEPVHCLLVGIAALLELDDGDQLLGAVHRDRYRRDPAAGDLLHRRLDVLGVVVAATDDQQILDAADDEQLTLGDEAQVTGSQPGASGAPGDGSTSVAPKHRLLVRRLAPVARRDIVAVHPDLADQARRALAIRLGIDDPQRRCLRHFVFDQCGAGPGRTPLNAAGGQFVGIEVGRRRRFTPGAGGDEDRRLRQAVRGTHHVVPKVEVRKPIDEALAGWPARPVRRR